ncbi:MAG: porin family protein [Rhizobiales bacterium]|nr:porin family protein [Hyphomicrobiales bacterium]
MIKRVIAAAGFAVLAFSAQAADLGGRPISVPSAILSPGFNWTGFYLGATVGGAFGTSSRTTDTVFDPTGYFAATSVSAIGAQGRQSKTTSGFTGGVTAGYNWQFNNIVAGIETDFQYFGQNGTATNGAVYPCCAPTAFTVQSRVSTNWLWTLRPRLGVLATPNLLLFVSGGLALTSIRANFNFTDTFATAAESASFSNTKLGFAVGAGAEYAIASNWTIKAEYLYVNFGRVSTTSSNLTAFTPAIAFPGNAFTHSANLNSHIVRIGANYMFSTGGPAIAARY